MKALIASVLIAIVLISGCNTPNTGGTTPNTVGAATGSMTEEISKETLQFSNTTLPLSIAKLPELDIKKVENFESYKQFTDRTNELIEILNEKTDLFHIPKLDATREGWEKASKLITEYSPLIDNYNQVVSSAKTYKNNSSDENLKDFYIASGVFGLETGVIVWAVFYSAAYNSVGIAYRAVGLNRFAFECPSCVKIILSNAHWAVRTALVEASSQAAQEIGEMGKRYEDGGINALMDYLNRKIDVVKESGESFGDSLGKQIQALNLTQYLPEFPKIL
jgi:thiol-disulfide isomerase/thioredoxin